MKNCQLCKMNFLGKFHQMVDEKILGTDRISPKDIIIICPKCLLYNKRRTKYLKEIKIRFYYICFSFIFTWICSYFFCEQIIYLCTLPLFRARGAPPNLIFTELTEAFYIHIQTCTFISLIFFIILFFVELVTKRTYFRAVFYSRPLAYALASLLGAYHLVRLFYFLSNTSFYDVLKGSIWQ